MKQHEHCQVNRYSYIVLLVFVVLMLFTNCVKEQRPAPPNIGLTELSPLIKLWPIPNNHPLIGDSVSIKVVYSYCDSIRINDNLMDLSKSSFNTGPVLIDQKYIAVAYGYGKMTKDSILILPHP
jgi:hypothetical protein